MHMDLGLLDPNATENTGVPQSKMFLKKRVVFFSFRNLGNRIFIRTDVLGSKTLKKCFFWLPIGYPSVN